MTLIGRDADHCALAQEHPSVSRLHASLVFSRDGALYLTDLASARGSKLQRAANPSAGFVSLLPLEPTQVLRPAIIPQLRASGSHFDLMLLDRDMHATRLPLPILLSTTTS